MGADQPRRNGGACRHDAGGGSAFSCSARPRCRGLLPSRRLRGFLAGQRSVARRSSTCFETRPRADPLLLRYALALQAQHSKELPAQVEQLRDRFAASRLRGDRVHLREEARFTLHLLNAPQAALKLAQENWQVQKEPADVRILLEAALAARRCCCCRRGEGMAEQFPAGGCTAPTDRCATRLNKAQSRPLIMNRRRQRDETRVETIRPIAGDIRPRMGHSRRGGEPPRSASDRFGPRADNTDVYAFVSYDAANLARAPADRRVTFILNVNPGQDPSDGPNYFNFGDDVLYADPHRQRPGRQGR